MRNRIQKQSPLLCAWALCAVLTLETGCAVRKTQLPSDDVQAPEATSNSSGLELVAIAGTNDIHGGLAPQIRNTREPEGTPPQTYESGGAPVLASYLRILKKQYGGKFLWLDGGDQFQGTLESNLDRGAPMVEFFNKLGLTASAIGNHEFDFGQEALRARMTEARYPYLASNIEDRATGALAQFPNTYPSRIVVAGGAANGVRVGLIGLSTLDTPTTTLATAVRSLRFASLADATARESQRLRTQGAQVIVLVSHVGLKCLPGRMTPNRALRKISDSQGECGEKDEMVRLLKALPPNTVDAVVAGHSHQIVHHWINGVPVIQAGASGKYLNVLYLYYDPAQKKILPERTRIEGPIPICARVFERQGDCNGDRPAPPQGRGQLIEPRFHGQAVQADSEISSWLGPILAKSEQEKKRVIAQAARPIEHERLKESEFANLLSDAIRDSAKADIGLVNGGGIRAPIEQGPITFGAVFRSIPFDNAVSTLTLTGREVRLILRIAESGSRGFFGVSGVTLKLIDLQDEAPASDLNGNQKIEPWEINRLVEVRTSDGKLLSDTKTYRLATLDFLVNGGDDLGWIMAQLPHDKIETGKLVRDVFVDYLAARKVINSTDAPLVDPNHPRFIFKRAVKHKRARRGKLKK